MLAVLEVIVWVLIVFVVLFVLCVIGFVASVIKEHRQAKRKQAATDMNGWATRSTGTLWRCDLCNRVFPNSEGWHDPSRHFRYYHRPVPVGPEDGARWRT